MPKYRVQLVGAEYGEKAVVETSILDKFYQVVLHLHGHAYEAVASDYFEAFCRVRLQLEAKGILPLCYGASQNVYPVGMCRQMGGGMMAYKLAMGQQPINTNLVLIFADGDGMSPVTVARQKEYFEEWNRSVTES